MKYSCPWEDLVDFQSYSEFARLVVWIASQVSEKTAFKVPVIDLYAGPGFKER